MIRRSLLIAAASLVAACGPSQASVPGPRDAAVRLTDGPLDASFGPRKPMFVFGPYEALAPGERRLLESSAIALEAGGPALSGQRLYDELAARQPKWLANYLNQVAVLATIRLAPDITALDYVRRIERLKINHVFADVDPKLVQAIQVRASKRPADRTQFVGPENSGLLHGKYDLSFRENRAYTSQQFCFSTRDAMTKLDVDLDEECPLAGDKIATARHLLRAAKHEVLRKIPGEQYGENSEPDGLFRRLTRPPVKPNGKPDKVGRAIQPSYALGPGAHAAEPDPEAQ